MVTTGDRSFKKINSTCRIIMKSKVSNNKMSTKKEAYAIVRKYEKKHYRKVEEEDYEKDGYDLKSFRGSNRKILERCIEVKGSRSDKIQWRWLEQKQQNNIKTNPKFYLYFVKKIGSKNPEVFAISAKKLKEIKPKVIRHYKYTKKQFKPEIWEKV